MVGKTWIPLRMGGKLSGVGKDVDAMDRVNLFVLSFATDLDEGSDGILRVYELIRIKQFGDELAQNDRCRRELANRSRIFTPQHRDPGNAAQQRVDRMQDFQ